MMLSIAFLFIVFISLWGIKALIGKLSLVSSQVTQDSIDFHPLAGELKKESVQLEEKGNEQAAFLHETTASLTQISSMILSTSQNVEDFGQISETFSQTVADGQNNVNQLLSAIADINHSNDMMASQFERSNQELNEIIKLIKEISIKTQVINEIAFQTKLLSFNASVEATRAGEHGKGFAVVADEVGNLAKMSGSAADEIAVNLLESTGTVQKIIEGSSHKINELMRKSATNIKEGLKTTNLFEGVFNKIVNNSLEMNQKIAEIAKAIKEQSEGVAQIEEAMSNLDKVTQNNLSTSSKVSLCSEKMEMKSENLNRGVEDLSVAINGKKAYIHRPPEMEV